MKTNDYIKFMLLDVYEWFITAKSVGIKNSPNYLLFIPNKNINNLFGIYYCFAGDGVDYHLYKRIPINE